MIDDKIGDILPEFIGKPDSVSISVGNSGVVICQMMDKPTANEIGDSMHGAAEFRFVSINGLIQIAFKLGSQPWNDASYSPMIGETPAFPDVLDDNAGLALILMLVDTSTGKLCSIRLFGLSNRFSSSLIRSINEIVSTGQPMSVEEYYARSSYIQSKYSSKNLADMAVAYCKFNN